MEIIENWPIAIQVLTFVVAFNVLLTGIKSALDLIKDKTATQFDNKAADLLGSVVGMLSKVIDMIGFNPAHKK